MTLPKVTFAAVTYFGKPLSEGLEDLNGAFVVTGLAKRGGFGGFRQFHLFLPVAQRAVALRCARRW